MNKVVSNTVEVDPLCYEGGDLFKSEGGGLYILSYSDGDYECISLEDGNSWNGIGTLDEATEDLEYLGSAKIIVDFD